MKDSLFHLQTWTSLLSVPILVTLAMLSKEQGITVLGVCFVYEVIFVQNYFDNLLAGHPTKFNDWRGGLVRITTLIASGLGLLFLRFQVRMDVAHLLHQHIFVF